jgi:hypothetical protein
VRGRTHINMTKNMFPYIPIRNIEAVNSRLDNSKMVDKTINALFNKETTDYFGLSHRGGHRSLNHDVASAMLVASLIDKEYGPKIAMAHLMEDQMSNLLLDKYGYEGRDLVEAVLNFTLRKNYKRKQRMFHKKSLYY